MAGIDEAGRGPLAGPVVAAAVVLPMDFDTRGLDDSKKLASGLRAELHERLTTSPAVAWAVKVVAAAEIDRLNILEATRAAMRAAFLALKPAAAHALIDGLPVPAFPSPQTALVGGDARSFSIAAASVIAKVTRDRLMDALDAAYPAYGFAKHKGYPTPEHLARLREHGPCPEHRRSYAPVAQAELFA